MRWWILAPLICVAFSAECQTRAPVGITTGEVRIEYCDNDARLAVATIRVQVVFANRSKKNLILSRDFSPGEPDEYVTVIDMAGKVVLVVHPSYYDTERVEPLGRAPDDKQFEIVKPGTSVEREIVIGLPISKDPSVTGAVAPGHYRISARRSTWPFYADADRARRTRRQWSKYGLLVVQQVRVDNIGVEISPPHQMPTCK
jgi:hypothetical protein